MSIVIYIRRFSRYLEEKYYREFGKWRVRIYDSRRILDKSEKEV